MNESINIFKNVWITIVAILITALIVGGSVYWWQKSIVINLKSETLKTQQILQEQINKLQIEIEQLKKTHYTVETGTIENLFKVYGTDKEANDEEINFYVIIPNNLSLLEKLKLLADKLSRFKFSYHPISILRIDNRNNKKIAVIELKEELAYSWRGGYFQGTAGGRSTTLTLTNTFLQEDYKGEWIDGVEFYYEGKPISDDWDHISLSGTIYRKSK